MHLENSIHFSNAARAIENPFFVDIGTLQAIAIAITADKSEGIHIRSEGELPHEGPVVTGVASRCIAPNLDILSRQSRSILKDGSTQNLIRAVSYFHLFFEAIHPMRDGNGRIGRLFITAALRKNIAEVSNFFKDNESVYKSIFLSKISDEQRYEIMIDFIGRLAGIETECLDSSLPYPLHPESTVRVDGRFRFVTNTEYNKLIALGIVPS